MKKALLLLLVIGAVTASYASNLRNEIIAMNAKVGSAMLHKSVKEFSAAVKGRVTPDFKYIEGGHSMDFDSMVAGMAMGFKSVSKITAVQTKLLSLMEKPRSATAKSIHVVKAISLDAKHKAHKVVYTGTSVEKYVLKHGKWLLSSMSWKNGSATQDGKPVKS